MPETNPDYQNVVHAYSPNTGFISNTGELHLNPFGNRDYYPRPKIQTLLLTISNEPVEMTYGVDYNPTKIFAGTYNWKWGNFVEETGFFNYRNMCLTYPIKTTFASINIANFIYQRIDGFPYFDGLNNAYGGTLGEKIESDVLNFEFKFLASRVHFAYKLKPGVGYYYDWI